jgi:phosphonate transport system ATP-binding protein
MISLHQVNLARKFGQRFIGLRDGKKVFDGYREEMTMEIIDEIYGDIDTEGMLAETDVDSDDGSGGGNASSGTHAQSEGGAV